MSNLTSFNDYMATLSTDSQARIHAQTQAMIKEIEPTAQAESEQVTLTLPSNIIAWLKKNQQAGQDLPTQINNLLDEAILNHAPA